MTRLIQPKDIPETLWDAETERIHLAPYLLTAWKHLLQHAGLEQQAMEPVPKGEIGGLGKKETDDHLAWRFSGSSARVQLGFLDPRDELGGVTDAFAKVFSGGTVLVADLPCGSGAAVLTLLTCIAELRRQGCIPRHPLNVRVVGGELSVFARDYASRAMEHIKEELAEQAIWVSAEFLSWDALDKFSTADLTKRLILAGQECSARLMVFANFSGFLQEQGNWENALPQFQNLFVHGRDNNSYAIWIEPQTKQVGGNSGFFSVALDWFKKLFSIFHTKDDQDALQVKNLGKSRAKVQHPLREHQFNVHLEIQRFDLPLKKAKT
ncbi:hypothetical protein [Chromobacterium amazonense]|uniref:hypothetical protein n=1 Tax=Chromobacterium amazonense TaxID=1382803 RepID=UPI00237E4039|nr:hypothetical protein [Chromobacterium amazonense]MDE1716156.1 hypothetical protein [Chromobacterium amazonense]